ncbi:hypothetical protein [Nocardioides gilvus]|uniref:hypothetical protein n=1 Tax=Nocardioides gilvus TaxID=1735589 RepID=UPI000D743EAC|nr:hypothetical protein [Nocardioides gilvus]
MRDALTYAGWLLRFRPLIGVLTVAVTVAVVAVGVLSVPNLIADPMIPRTRLSLLLSCLAATLVVALVEPLLGLEERLSPRRMPWVRVAAIAIVVVFLLGLVVLLRSALVGSLFVGPAGAYAGLVGIALFFSRANVFLGLLAPWAYAMTGLTLGYDEAIHGRLSLQPWAWLVSPDDLSVSRWLGVLLMLGIGVHAVPRR